MTPCLPPDITCSGWKKAFEKSKDGFWIVDSEVKQKKKAGLMHHIARFL